MPDTAIAERIGRHVLTATEFDVLWERLGLGTTPVVLRIESPGRTHTERREICDTGWQGLRDRGLVQAGGPDPELVRLLHLLARPSRRLELRAWWGRSVRAVAAGHTGEGVLAVRQDATVTLSGCGSLPTALVGEIPPLRPRPGRAATVPTQTLLAACTVPDPRRALIAQGVATSEAGLLARMAAGDVRRAQIVALLADARGVPHRHGGVLTLLDARTGRCLLTRATADDGVEWTTIAPVDDRRLRHRVAGLLDDPP